MHVSVHTLAGTRGLAGSIAGTLYTTPFPAQTPRPPAHRRIHLTGSIDDDDDDDTVARGRPTGRPSNFRWPLPSLPFWKLRSEHRIGSRTFQKDIIARTVPAGDGERREVAGRVVRGEPHRLPRVLQLPLGRRRLRRHRGSHRDIGDPGGGALSSCVRCKDLEMPRRDRDREGKDRRSAGLRRISFGEWE